MAGRAMLTSALRRSPSCSLLLRASAPARSINSKSGVVHRAAPAPTATPSLQSANAPPPAPLQGQGKSTLQHIHHERSGISVFVHPTTISLASPQHGIHEPVHFDHVWLRDACIEPNSVQPDTKQKLFHTSDIAIPDSRGLLAGPDAVRLLEEGDEELPRLQLSFAPAHAVTNAFSAAFSSVPPSSDKPHISHLPLALLLEHAQPALYASSHGDIGGAARSWAAKDLSPAFARSPSPPRAQDVVPGERMDVEAATSRPARLTWASLLSAKDSGGDAKAEATAARFALVNSLMRDGIAFVTSLPTDTTGNEVDASSPTSPSLARLAEMLGEIRHTFYGPLWDVRSLGSTSRNIAYTNLDLGLHMDLLYFQNPPRFQFLHMLRNEVRGGESIFVDSFAVAQKMWDDHRDQFRVLAETPVGFHYQNDNRHYRYTHPTFELATSSSGHAGPSSAATTMPRLCAVNYSPPFQSPLPPPTADRERFYEALKTFADLTLSDEFRYERTLSPGECVIFDNRRVLHARRGFEWDETENKQGGQIKRWLKGCYVDGDAIWSTYRTLLAKAQPKGKLGL
ncbi:Clavaminate synthase-like protein [Acaromyces ingoldii]|uniref:Clavaminate synthase-like protein n=1 Tax=Acaromyces ingoldii TaxID=215250 RepID=A0A316YK29_9BASI|nr:Clavaminate synthase-like protein [Acaromyces ingoldii]PWN89532.1 Clavaminate synthase-like protein [Acaromyces ingoldii]